MYWHPEDPAASGDQDEGWHGSDMRMFTGDYFRAVGLDVVQGQAPDEVDVEAEPVAWVSRSLADEVFGDADPVGQRLGAANAPRRPVGVVEDVPVDARGRVTRHTYIPHAQSADDRNWALIQTVAARGGLVALRDRIRSELRSMDPELVLHRPRPLEGVVGTSRAQDRFATVLMGAFALLALVLSVVGTYGVLAGSVAARRREIGIRMALGAEPERVRGMVLRYAAALTLPGMALGLLVALAGARVLESLLFQVGSGDPASYALAVVKRIARPGEPGSLGRPLLILLALSLGSQRRRHDNSLTLAHRLQPSPCGPCESSVRRSRRSRHCRDWR